METVKKITMFFFISLIFHFYLILALLYTVDKRALDQFFNFFKNHKTQTAEQKADKNIEPVLEDVIVETMTSSEKTPEKGKISDKPNLNSGVKGNSDNYNYINFSPGNKQIQINPVNIPENKTAVPDTKQGQPVQEDKNPVAGVQPEKNTLNSNRGGDDYHTSFFDVYKPVDITMNNQGDLSLATIPTKYADYFLAVQKKIADKWGTFFPVFQYYQGIIKSGNVIIHFNIETNGDISGAAVIKSYGYSIIDESCLNAVIYSKNFGPLPDELKAKSPVSIDFNFQYLSRQ